MTLFLNKSKSKILKAVVADEHGAALQRAIVTPAEVTPSRLDDSIENAALPRGKTTGYPVEFPVSVVLFPR